MTNRPERAHQGPTSRVPMVSRGSANDGRTHDAVWWVVHYAGARDYAQALLDTPEPAGHGVGGRARTTAAL